MNRDMWRFVSLKPKLSV